MGFSFGHGRASMQNCILVLHLPASSFFPCYLMRPCLGIQSFSSLFGLSGCLQAAGFLVVVECGWAEEIDAGLRGLMCVGWCHGTSGGVCFCSVFSVFFIVQYSLCHVELPIFLFFFSCFSFSSVLVLCSFLFLSCGFVMAFPSLSHFVSKYEMAFPLFFIFVKKFCQ